MCVILWSYQYLYDYFENVAILKSMEFEGGDNETAVFYGSRLGLQVLPLPFGGGFIPEP